MHIRAEGSWPNNSIGGNAVRSRVEPKGGDTKSMITATTQSHTNWLCEGLTVLTRSVRLWWGHR